MYVNVLHARSSIKAMKELKHCLKSNAEGEGEREKKLERKSEIKKDILYKYDQ